MRATISNSPQTLQPLTVSFAFLFFAFSVIRLYIFLGNPFLECLFLKKGSLQLKKGAKWALFNYFQINMGKFSENKYLLIFQTTNFTLKAHAILLSLKNLLLLIDTTLHLKSCFHLYKAQGLCDHVF